MEIINYVNKNTSTSTLQRKKTSFSLEIFIYRQNKYKQRRNRQRRYERIAQNKVSLQTNHLNVDFSLRNFIFCLNKMKGLILGIIISALLIIGAIVIHKHLNNKIIPATFDYAYEAEKEIMAKAMRNFVLETENDDFTEDGTLSATTVFTFTSPVKYENYKVKSGDSISTISRKFGLTNISTLISVNNISNVRSLQVGKILEIPSIDGIIHVVKSGESLNSIAAKYNCEIAAILDVNDMTTDVLKSGERLFIPGKALDQETLKKALGELFITPLVGNYRLTSAYGYRADPFTGVRSFHTGIDLAINTGTPIKASMEGKIATAGWNNVYGNYVIITHSNGYRTLYAHMQKYIVATGQKVNQGETIGYVGSTGYSTGPHLHFSVYKNNKLIDPLTVLK